MVGIFNSCLYWAYQSLVRSYGNRGSIRINTVPAYGIGINIVPAYRIMALAYGRDRMIRMNIVLYGSSVEIIITIYLTNGIIILSYSRYPHPRSNKLHRGVHNDDFYRPRN